MRGLALIILFRPVAEFLSPESLLVTTLSLGAAYVFMHTTFL